MSLSNAIEKGGLSVCVQVVGGTTLTDQVFHGLHVAFSAGVVKGGLP